MVGLVLLFLGLGVLLWLRALGGTNERVGSTLEPRVDLADDDMEPARHGIDWNSSSWMI